VRITPRITPSANPGYGLIETHNACPWVMPGVRRFVLRRARLAIYNARQRLLLGVVEVPGQLFTQPRTDFGNIDWPRDLIS